MACHSVRFLNVILSLFLVTVSHAIPINNGLLAQPEVVCQSDRVGIVFRTQNSFEGNVYVKGFFERPNCHRGATGTRDVNIILPFFTSECGVRRIRRANPSGVSIISTVVIMFHSSFLTKVDRAFRVECFYMESEKTVSTDLEVSMITTIPISQSIVMPVCTYSVLSGGPNGPPIRYARIGEKAYHRWSCTGGSAEIFCMLVHTCTVDDGRGTVQLLLDSNGCSLDPFLLQELEYVNDVTAGREAHVFKFADKPSLYFTCQISLVLKQLGTCTRPSDQCPSLVRGKREIQNDNGSILANIQVATPPLDVLEIVDNESGQDMARLFPLSYDKYGRSLIGQRWDGDDICLNPVLLGSIISLTLTFLFTSVIFGVISFAKRSNRSSAEKKALQTKADLWMCHS